ncbi:MAG: glutamate--tRNA ligase [Erysipelotrichaceae bacterium]|nr:glutamate--tRNA ligase [Erysipelotrichaceae bacterium]
MNNQLLADLLYPNITKTPADYENIYPKRALDDNAEVMRIAPSPTGFIHLGNLYGALADERIAHQSNGVFFLRIEDTDNKRLVKGAVETIISTFDYFKIEFDEGAEVKNNNGNHYGPYYQRQRTDIYQAYAKDLVRKGLAYPCFCDEEHLKQQRTKQQELKITTGYYGPWAVCRNLDFELIKANIEANKSFVIRLRSNGDPKIKHSFHDEIKGDITVIENDQDVILLKADGIPTYHFAHAVDDHLMHTTIVLRGEEWLGTLPIHLELFKALNHPLPKFAHTSQLMKMDNGIKRKLSKRKDPELSLDYYRQLGYHPDAVKIYLMTLLNWNFEEWFLKNPDADITAFKFSVNKMGQSGALFDLDKLNNISKTFLSKKEPEEIMMYLKNFVQENDASKMDIYFKDEAYLLQILNLGMGTNLKKRRKDYIYASQILASIAYYFDDVYQPSYDFIFDKSLCIKIIEAFIANYDHRDDNAQWFDKLKAIATQFNIAAEMNDYKNNPDAYIGNISELAEVLRVATTGYKNTPDLWSIMQIMQEKRVLTRLHQALDTLNGKM